MTKEKRSRYVKSTFNYALFELRIALYELIVAVVSAYPGKSSAIAEAFTARKQVVQRRFEEYAQEFTNE